MTETVLLVDDDDSLRLVLKRALSRRGFEVLEACSAEKHNALVFGDLYDENSQISQELRKHGGKQIRGDLGLNTGVRYRGI